MSLSGWKNNQKLSLRIYADLNDEDLTNFPVLVHLSSSSGTNHFDCSDVFAKLGYNSKKIAIEDGDTGNQCYCEIEFWDAGNSKAVLHVKVPFVSSSSDTLLNLYYDETHADNTSYVGDTGDTAAQNVWDSNFVAVYHMAQAPSGTAPQILDSTSNANHGTSNGSMTSGDLIDFDIGKALNFDGVDDYIDVGDIVNPDKLTMEAYYATATTSTDGHLTLVTGAGEGWLYLDSNYNITGAFYQNGLWYLTGSNGACNDAEPHYGTMIYDGYTMSVVSDDVFSVSEKGASLPHGNTAWRIGARWDADTNNGYFDGKIAEIRVSDIARSDAWVKATHMTLRDNFLKIKKVKTISVLSQPYSLPPYIVKNFYSQPYSITETVIAKFVQIYGLKMVAFWVQRYGDAPVVRAVLDQYYGDAAKVLAVFEQPYRSAYQVRSTHEQPYSLPAPLVKIFEQRYSITAAQVRGVYDQLYAIKDTDLARRSWVQPWLIVDGGLGVRRYNVTVTVGGQELKVVHVNIEASRDQYALSCELQLAGQADYLACRIMAELLVTIDSETFTFFVESKSRNRRHGQITYTIQGLSPAARLDAPYSEPWPDDLSGMASDIADQVAGGLVTIDWQTVDWFIPADTLLAGDATPVQIIRQLAGAAGAILQSQPDGTLVIEPLYPTPVPDWDSVTPDYTLSDALDFFSTNEDFDHRPGYNLYRVSDQAESLDTVRIEEETISATEKIIRVYQAPWQDDFYLDNTGGAWVIIEPLGIEQKLAEDELVEFVGGEGHTRYPIYGASAMSWLQEPLGTVTMAEDGRLTASVAGESLLRISYHTKCRKYRAIDHQVEPVQIVARETV